LEQSQHESHINKIPFTASSEYYLLLQRRLLALETRHLDIMEKLAVVQQWNNSINNRIKRIQF